MLSPIQLLHLHTDFAHRYWSDLLLHAEERPFVIDATAGNGHDALVLAKALEAAGGGRLTAVDVQQEAIDATRAKLSASGEWSSVDLEWHVGDHCSLLEGLDEACATLVTFNLGYLPGGDKTITTTADSTLRALAAAERAVSPGGCISVTLYPGHEEGRREEEQVLAHAAALQQGGWSVLHSELLNQRSKRDPAIRAPSLLLLQRIN